MTGRQVAFFFRQLDAQSGVLAEVRHLLALDPICRGALPPPLRRSVSVGGYRNGRIKLYATNGPAAAKLRQMAESLAAELRARGVEVTAIDVQVQVPVGKSANSTDPRSLPAKAVEELKALRDELAPSPLRDSVERLLRRVRKRD